MTKLTIGEHYENIFRINIVQILFTRHNQIRFLCLGRTGRTISRTVRYDYNSVSHIRNERFGNTDPVFKLLFHEKLVHV